MDYVRKIERFVCEKLDQNAFENFMKEKNRELEKSAPTDEKLEQKLDELMASASFEKNRTNDENIKETRYTVLTEYVDEINIIDIIVEYERQIIYSEIKDRKRTDRYKLVKEAKDIGYVFSMNFFHMNDLDKVIHHEYEKEDKKRFKKIDDGLPKLNLAPLYAEDKESRYECVSQE